MTKVTEGDIELRKLPAASIYKICNILEFGGGWKELMAVIPVECKEGNPLKYTVDDMKLIEQESERGRRSCAEVLLEEWGTSGKCRPTVSTLLHCLCKAQLFRAADTVAELLQVEPPARPTEGPAAAVVYPTSVDLQEVKTSPSAPPLSTCVSSATLLPPDNPDDLTERVHSGSPTLKRLSYQLLESATDRFSDSLMLGGGAFGTVFQANLPHLGAVAVKRIKVNGSDGNPIEQFRNEVKVLAQLTHTNVLPLLGYSDDSSQFCLVYKFMKHGSLQDQLRNKNNPYMKQWRGRVEIAVGTARGLLQLHSMTPPLVHRDVKSANILLDDNFTPKLGDFGLVHLGSTGTHTVSSLKTQTAIGTAAYMAPEAHYGNVSVKLDIFSFGVVLLELATGLPPYDETREEGCDLITYVLCVGEQETLVDKSTDWPQDVSTSLFELADSCLVRIPKQRPTTKAILDTLESITSRQIMEKDN